MDRSLSSKLDLLRSLARQLVSLSKRFEPFVPGHRPTLADTMAQLGSLEKLARASLSTLLPPPQTSEGDPDPKPARRGVAGIGASPARQAQGTPIGDSSLSRFSSRNTEYGSILKNPSIVQALLALNARNEATSRKKLEPRPEAGGQSLRFASQDFMIAEPPGIQATAKPAPYRSHSSPTTSIFRTTDDSDEPT